MNKFEMFFKRYLIDVKEEMHRRWKMFAISLVAISPYLILNSEFCEKIFCIAAGYYLNAEKIEFLDENSSVIFHNVNFQNQTFNLKNASLSLHWKFNWTYEEIQIGECSIEKGELIFLENPRQTPSSEEKKPFSLPKWMLWLPRIHFKKIYAKDVSALNRNENFHLKFFEMNDFKIEFCSKSKSNTLFSTLAKNDSKILDADLIFSKLAQIQSSLDLFQHYQSMAKVSIASLEGHLQKIVQDHTEDYEIKINALELTPRHLQCQYLMGRFNNYELFGAGEVVVDKINPFQFKCRLVQKDLFSNPEIVNELGVLIIQGNEQFNTGFKVGGKIAKEFFQNFIFKSYGLSLQDLDFCFKANSDNQVYFQSSVIVAEKNQKISFECKGSRQAASSWNFDGNFYSSAPFELPLKFLRYPALQTSKIEIFPQIGLRYFYPEQGKNIGQLALSGNFACTSGKIDMNLMNFSKSLSTFVAEEIMLNAEPSAEFLKNELAAPMEEELNSGNKKLFPKIFFEALTLRIDPALKIFCNGLDAFLEGSIIFSNAIDDLVVEGEIFGKPLIEGAPINKLPLKLIQARVYSDGKVINDINLEVSFDVLSDARGKQIPFESFLVLCSNNTFKILARKRGSIAFENLVHINWADTQSLGNDSSQSLLHFLGVIIVGGLGDFIRNIVPLERAERIIENMIPRILPRPHVQLVQPCMKELNQLLLQLMSMDWNGWANFWIGMNFPLSGILQDKNISEGDKKNELQVVLDLFFSRRLSVALEASPDIGCSFSFQCDWNELF